MNKIKIISRIQKTVLRKFALLQFTLSVVILGFFSNLIFSDPAFAQAKGGIGNSEMYLSAGYAGLASSASEYDIAPGIQLAPFASLTWLQLGGELTYQKVSYRDGSSNNLMIIAGPTVNIGPFLSDSVFISLGFAYRSGSSGVIDGTTVDPDGLGFYFMAGKHFPIGANFSLRPSLGVVSCGTTGMVFRPLALSYTF